MASQAEALLADILHITEYFSRRPADSQTDEARQEFVQHLEDLIDCIKRGYPIPNATTVMAIVQQLRKP